MVSFITDMLNILHDNILLTLVNVPAPSCFCSKSNYHLLKAIWVLCLSSQIVCLSEHVTWDEYRVKFLASKGFNERVVAEKIKNNEELKLDEESKWKDHL